MGDRVAVLCDGVLQQCAAPRELYRQPANVFVAGFIGSPSMNLITLPSAQGSVTLGGWEIRTPRSDGPTVVVGIRPEHLEVNDCGFDVEVEMVEELGADAYVYGRVSGSPEPVVARVDGLDPPPRGSRLRLRPAPEHIHFFGADGLPIGD